MKYGDISLFIYVDISLSKSGDISLTFSGTKISIMFLTDVLQLSTDVQQLSKVVKIFSNLYFELFCYMQNIEFLTLKISDLLLI